MYGKESSSSEDVEWTHTEDLNLHFDPELKKTKKQQQQNNKKQTNKQQRQKNNQVCNIKETSWVAKKQVVPKTMGGQTHRIWILTLTFTLKTASKPFLQHSGLRCKRSTTASLAAQRSAVQRIRDTQFLKVWTVTVTLTLSDWNCLACWGIWWCSIQSLVAKGSTTHMIWDERWFCEKLNQTDNIFMPWRKPPPPPRMTLRFMVMHHHIQFSYKWFSGSKDVVRTKLGHTDRQTLWFKYAPSPKKKQKQKNNHNKNNNKTTTTKT